MPWGAIDFVSGVSGDLVKFLNSQFFSSLFSAMAGAFGGAWAAQRSSERAKLREKLEQEVRSCNRAIEICASIANAHIALKRQHVLFLKTEYDERRAKVVELFESLGRTGSPPTLVNAGELNARTLDHVRTRTAPLEALMDGLAVSGRPRMLLTFLVHSAEALTESIRARNQLLDTFKEVSAKDPDRMVRLAFGLRLPEGGRDTTYKDLVDGIYMETDDCIEFSRRIGNDLETHGKRVRQAYQRRFKHPIPRISEVSYRSAYDAALMPDPSQYEAMAGAYISAVPATHGSWLKKQWAGMRRRCRASRSVVAKNLF